MKAESIEYVLNALGGDGAYGRSGDHLMSNCVHAPWGHARGEDTSKKLGVLVTDGMSPCNCFYPGCLPPEAHTLLGLVQLVGGKRVAAGDMTASDLSNLKAFVIMAEEEDDVASDTRWSAPKPKEAIPQDILAACTGTAPYWLSRGVSQRAATAWRLGEYGGRALMPFLDRRGEVVAVQGRLLPGQAKDAYPWEKKAHDEKYRSFPVGFARSELLVGEHLIRQPVHALLVVESPFDAIALTDWLGESLDTRLKLLEDPTHTWAVVATMGGEVAELQVQKMVELLADGGELLLGMDMDHAGRLATRKLIGADKHLRGGHDLYRRVPRISEVTWTRKDATDTDEGKVPLDTVRAEALAAIANREDWLSKRMALGFE